MAKHSEFYKGARKRRNYAFIPALILIFTISVGVVLFYSMQKYAVVSKDGVEVVLPILDDGKTVINDQGEEVRVFDVVDAPLVFEEADYSNYKAEAGKYLQPVRAIFVPSADVNLAKLEEYALRLKTGNALVLEMKPRSGMLNWSTQAYEAVNYGLNITTEITNAMPQYIEMLKERDIYLVAKISCCIDELFASRSTTVTIRNEIGANYMDVNGTWLDPYNQSVRNYTVALCEELFAMGFDEVMLADVAHPTLTEPINLMYTREMSTQPSSVNAVCGFAVYVAEQLRDVDGVLSIYVDSKQALVKPDYTTGQDAVLFMKLYDRVYLETDKFAYPYNVADIEQNVSIGEVHDRLVPVVINYLPDNSSWVLVDREEIAAD